MSELFSPVEVLYQPLQLPLHPCILIRKQKTGTPGPHHPADRITSKHTIVHPKYHLHRRARGQLQLRLSLDVASTHADIQHPPAKQHRPVLHHHLCPRIHGITRMLPPLDNALLRGYPLLLILSRFVHCSAPTQEFVQRAQEVHSSPIGIVSQNITKTPARSFNREPLRVSSTCEGQFS